MAKQVEPPFNTLHNAQQEIIALNMSLDPSNPRSINFLNPKVAIITWCPILSCNFCSSCFSHNSSWWDQQYLWLSLAFWHCGCPPPVTTCHTGLWEQYYCTCDDCKRHIPCSTIFTTDVCYLYFGLVHAFLNIQTIRNINTKNCRNDSCNYNPDIQHLLELTEALSPPPRETVCVVRFPSATALYFVQFFGTLSAHFSWQL
jgi:hypothetical protein